MFHNKRLEKIESTLASLQQEIEKLKEVEGVWSRDTGKFIKKSKAYKVEIWTPFRGSEDIFIEKKPNYSSMVFDGYEGYYKYRDWHGENVEKPSPKLS